jgi:4-hydroxybenzoate polyprenyltransferase
MLKRLRYLLELIRFSHTLFALPFALLAAVMAWTTPTADGADIAFRWWDLLGIVLCMTTARSAAMAMNRIADRRWDAENPRTAGRHLPAGLLSQPTVVAFATISALLFIASTLIFLPNWLPAALSVPVLMFLCGYSWTKRFTRFAHFWLGAALMLAPICAWIAIRGQFLLANAADLLPSVMLGAAVLVWVGGFDIIYACLDTEFDRKAKLHSMPARMGVTAALRLAAVCHLVMIVLLAALPWICPRVGFGWLYGCGIAAVAVLLVYEHALVRPSDLKRVNVAFFNVNVVVSVGLLAIGTIDLLI